MIIYTAIYDITKFSEEEFKNFLVFIYNFSKNKINIDKKNSVILFSTNIAYAVLNKDILQNYATKVFLIVGKQNKATLNKQVKIAKNLQKIQISRGEY
jgi:hypothetical protein